MSSEEQNYPQLLTVDPKHSVLRRGIHVMGVALRVEGVTSYLTWLGFVNSTQTGVAQGERTSTKELPLSDCSVSKTVGHFLD